MKKNILSILFIISVLIACQEQKNDKYPSGLPVIGFKQPIEREVNGKKIIDSLEHVIPPFSFVNQEGRTITEKEVEGKIYIVDFFFTSCPTICPRVKKNMKTVYEKYKSRPDFLILSHSIDTKYDTVGRLAWYAEKFKIDAQTWHLLTGKKEDIYRMASQYYIAALEDKESPGGFDHSGAIALVDRQRRIRGMYDGTDAEKVAQLMVDIQKLIELE